MAPSGQPPAVDAGARTFEPRPASERALRGLATWLAGPVDTAVIAGAAGAGTTFVLRRFEAQERERRAVLFSPFLHMEAEGLESWLEGLAGAAGFGTLDGWLAAAPRAPLLLVDEAHDATPAALDALVRLRAARAPKLRVCLGGCAGPALERATRHLGGGGVLVLELPPWSEDDLRRFAAALCAVAPADSAALVAGAEGSPGLLRLAWAELRDRPPATLSETPSPTGIVAEPAPPVPSPMPAAVPPAPRVPTIAAAVPPRAGTGGGSTGTAPSPAAPSPPAPLVAAPPAVSTGPRRAAPPALPRPVAPARTPLVEPPAAAAPPLRLPRRETPAVAAAPAALEPPVESPSAAPPSAPPPIAAAAPSREPAEQPPAALPAPRRARPIQRASAPRRRLRVPWFHAAALVVGFLLGLAGGWQGWDDREPARAPAPVEPAPAAPALEAVSAAPPVVPVAAPARHDVQVNARPWAWIRIDGEAVGVTPLVQRGLTAGSHEFEATFPDGRQQRRTVEIGPDSRFVSFAD
jgi:hypothetical protein